MAKNMAEREVNDSKPRYFVWKNLTKSVAQWQTASSNTYTFNRNIPTPVTDVEDAEYFASSNRFEETRDMKPLGSGNTSTTGQEATKGWLLSIGVAQKDAETLARAYGNKEGIYTDVAAGSDLVKAYGISKKSLDTITKEVMKKED